MVAYARALSKYHLHPEAKFLGGEWTDAGVLRRRHVRAISTMAIGKEADHLEEELGRSEDDEAANEIGLSLVDRVRLVTVILAAKKRFGVKALARAAGVSDHTISKVIGGFTIVPDRTLNAIAEGAAILAARAAERDAEEARLLAWARERSRSEGCNGFAERLGVDPDNLGKVLAGSRVPSAALLAKLRRRFGL